MGTAHPNMQIWLSEMDLSDLVPMESDRNVIYQPPGRAEEARSDQQPGKQTGRLTETRAEWAKSLLGKLNRGAVGC